jgi:hypothetical protein
VHWRDGVEAYVTPVAADEVGIAMLWNKERTRGDEQGQAAATTATASTRCSRASPRCGRASTAPRRPRAIAAPGRFANARAVSCAGRVVPHRRRRGLPRRDHR